MEYLTPIIIAIIMGISYKFLFHSYCMEKNRKKLLLKK